MKSVFLPCHMVNGSGRSQGSGVFAPVLERQQERDVERKSVAALRDIVSMDAPTRGFHSTARRESIMMSSQTCNLSSSLTSTIVARPKPDRTTQVCESNHNHSRKSKVH